MSVFRKSAALLASAVLVSAAGGVGAASLAASPTSSSGSAQTTGPSDVSPQAPETTPSYAIRPGVSPFYPLRPDGLLRNGLMQNPPTYG